VGQFTIKDCKDRQKRVSAIDALRKGASENLCSVDGNVCWNSFLPASRLGWRGSRRALRSPDVVSGSPSIVSEARKMAEGENLETNLLREFRSGALSPRVGSLANLLSNLTALVAAAQNDVSRCGLLRLEAGQIS
jgi:hypothetical protein